MIICPGNSFKHILYFSIFWILLGSLIIFGQGFYYYDSLAKLHIPDKGNIVKLTTITGILLIITCLVGLYTTRFNHEKTLAIFVIILLLMLWVMVTVTIKVFAYVHTSSEHISSLRESMFQEYSLYGIDAEVTDKINRIQTSFQCCGVVYGETKTFNRELLPWSCCKSNRVSGDCFDIDIFRKPCAVILFRNLKEQTTYILIVLITASVIELVIVLILLCILYLYGSVE